MVPDLRGHNRSDAPRDVAAYRLDVPVADVLALADGYGTGRIRLVGHDWGGGFAMPIDLDESYRRLVTTLDQGLGLFNP